MLKDFPNPKLIYVSHCLNVRVRISFLSNFKADKLDNKLIVLYI